jgi:NAD(P)-dependent dehydrogenase (short-subunit alcohol dehydrogenase family)
MLDLSLEGKVAVITGSSRGIGRSIALLFARAGAKVVVSSRKLDACHSVVSDIQAFGGEAMAVACNIGTKADCIRLIDSANMAFGKVDILVCNAAVNPHSGSIATVPDAVYDKIMNTNVRSNLWLAQQVFGQMKARRNGSIIIISSGAGLFGSSNFGVYALSKSADMQLARNFAVEWGQFNIRANVIAPGLIRTDMSAPILANKALEESILNSCPLRRIGEPHEIAGTALFLASELGAYVTGQTISVDGGMAVFKAG